MKHIFFLFVLAVLFYSCSSNVESINDVLKRSAKVAIDQSLDMAEKIDSLSGRLPRRYEEKTDRLITVPSRWWGSGFFPGVLWYLYDYSEDPELKKWAIEYSDRVEKEKSNTYDHDIGFQIYCSFGNAYRITQREEYKEVLKTAALSAIKRYDPDIGAIRSWDHHADKWQYPVIIDNMMNLELLMWAFHNTEDSVFYEIATSHADKTLENHFRNDFTCYHVVSYDTLSGEPHAKQTHQGAFDESVWSRGQAWALYGFTMMFRETGHERYLNLAQKIAEMLINHPNMPSDKIPYWDLLAEDIPNIYRDASAAAIIASALIELSGFVEKGKKNHYLSVAETQLKELSSPRYLSKPGTNGNFILKHSVGNLPNDNEVDVAIAYADYYFIEALLRRNNL